MVCDLAETYNIYNYEQLPVERVAVFVCGLRDNARVWQKLGKNNIDRELLVLIYDKLNWIAWTNTEAAHNGEAPPPRLFDKLFNIEQQEPDDETVKFDSPEDFKTAWERIKNGNDNRGRICPDNTIS